MKLTLELYDTCYTVETNHNDYDANELKEIFSRMLVQASFPPSVIDPEDGGRYEYVEDDEVVVNVEKLGEDKKLNFGVQCRDYRPDIVAEGLGG